MSLDGRKFEGKNCSTLSDVSFAQMGVLVVDTQISYAIWINSSWISWSVVGVLLYICCRKCQNSGWPPPRANPGLVVGGQLDLGVSLTIKSHLTKSAFPQSCEPWGPNSFFEKKRPSSSPDICHGGSCFLLNWAKTAVIYRVFVGYYVSVYT